MKNSLFFRINLIFFTIQTFTGTIFNPLFAQITDSFTDGDFSHNPTWVGDTLNFKVNSAFQLQLDAPAAGKSYLMVPTTFSTDQMEWQMSIKCTFSPSGNNFTRFYLISAQQNLNDPNNQAIFLQLGENLSQDALELFYQEGTTLTSICRGKAATIAKPFDIRIKVRYTAPGLWELFLDTLKTGQFYQDASAIFMQLPQHQGFGVSTTYTSSNIRNFYFDDFYFGPHYIDTVPPEVTQLIPHSHGRSIEVCFSEPINPLSALQPSAYLIDDSFFPDTINIWGADRDRVLLNFIAPLAIGEHSIAISGIRDDADNLSSPYFSYFQIKRVQRNELLITEIMADPTPQVELPAVEYVELYNPSQWDTVQLNNWSLRLGSSVKKITSMLLPPQTYGLIVPQSEIPLFEPFCDLIYGVSSLGITNGGQEITLLNEENEVIHVVDFKVDWHSNLFKRDGGWSLEMIDLENPCSGESNWDSSEDPSGGTPGRANSIAGANPDNELPYLEKVTYLDSTQILLHFNETILMQPDLIPIRIVPEIPIVSVTLVQPQQKQIRVQLGRSLAKKQVYRVIISDTIYDCVGNQVVIESEGRVGVPEKVDYFDLIINEILTDSYQSTLADFVEIVNRSDKIIDLGKIYIGDGTLEKPERLVPMVRSGYLLFPQEYIAICKNRKLTLEQYNPVYPERLVQNDSLPNFPNSESVIYITDWAYQVVDWLHYTADFHSSFLSSTDGVSLEKIAIDLPTQNRNHWKSAAQTAGFGTPGYLNSQTAQILPEKSKLGIDPPVFSPNGDGYQDFVTISYQTTASEGRISIYIYDKEGMLIKLLVNNEIVSPNTIYTWDGSTLDGTIAPTGIYLIRAEYWDLEGKREWEKGVVTLYRE